MSLVHPKYHVVLTDLARDRMTYTPDRPWPDPQRSVLRVNFAQDTFTVYFDENGRPSDLRMQLTVNAKQKIRSRRMTPRSEVHPSDD